MTHDLTGMQFGRLVVLSRSIQDPKKWNCVCVCGNKAEVYESNLTKNYTKSCGCLRKELSALRKTTHGLANTLEYVSWTAMIQRSTNPNLAGYKDYGGRGIQICDRWRSFEAFLADMGPRPSPNHSLDRYPDPNGNYEPSNCRWATSLEQNNNRRSVLSYEYQGKLWTARELAEHCGVVDFVNFRLRLALGWSVEKALRQPVIPRQRI